MPVLVLLLSLIGNYSIYRNSGKDLVSSSSETILTSTRNPNLFNLINVDRDSTYDLYCDTTLSFNDASFILSQIESDLVFVDSSELFPGTYSSILFNFIYSDNIYLVYFVKLGDDISLALIDVSNESIVSIIWSSAELVSSDFVILQGFNITSDFMFSDITNFTFPYLDSENIELLSNFFNVVPFYISSSYVSNNTLNFTFEQIIDNTTYYMSFFDISMFNTDYTFKKFQLPFLRNVFESVFNILEFESSYVSSFVLTSFTWMIQLLLLHVVVDTLAFIFKMYHKLMDKVV